MYDVIVIGAGASGLYFAAHAQGMKVLVIEKNERLGLKLLISGSGQCNVTHGGKAYDLLHHYGPHKSFVKHAIKSHDNKAVVKAFEKWGVPCYEREDGKVFPASLRSKDILSALLKAIEKNNVVIHTAESVEKAHFEGERFVVTTEKSVYQSKYLLLASGGLTYPQLGSSSVGYKLAKAFGHEVHTLRPGLTSIQCSKNAIIKLQGLVFKKATLHHPSSGQTFTGDLLITHFGLSGPLILDQSRYFKRGDDVIINVTSYNLEELESVFLACALESGGLPIAYFLNQIDVPDRMKQWVLDQLSIDKDKKIATIDKQQRKDMVKYLTSYKINIEDLTGFHQAMVTVGGVSIEEVTSKTMASHKCPPLFFAGEVLDIDGDTGGYNLQWAFSSAHLASESIKKRLKVADTI